jgi:hypothetical protein
MRILISGSSGLIGRSVSACLRKRGHEVIPLSRGAVNSGVFWQPDSGRYKSEDFEGFDVMLHLAGKSVTGSRWSESLKREIFKSRCRDTWLLSQIINRLRRPPSTLITASGIGYYGSRGDTILTESASPGKGFLADVCKQWEVATSSLQADKVRVIHTRFGVVLSEEGGALRRLLKQFQIGIGAVLGKGDQYLSWIALEDLSESIEFILKTPELSGAINVVSPHPETNMFFSQKLARSLGRSCWLRIPAWFLRLLMGKQIADEMILSSARVIPEKLLSKGFQFQYKKVEDFFSTLSK